MTHQVFNGGVERGAIHNAGGRDRVRGLPERRPEEPNRNNRTGRAQAQNDATPAHTNGSQRRNSSGPFTAVASTMFVLAGI